MHRYTWSFYIPDKYSAGVLQRVDIKAPVISDFRILYLPHLLNSGHFWGFQVRYWKRTRLPSHFQYLESQPRNSTDLPGQNGGEKKLLRGNILAGAPSSSQGRQWRDWLTNEKRTSFRFRLTQSRLLLSPQLRQPGFLFKLRWWLIIRSWPTLLPAPRERTKRYTQAGLRATLVGNVLNIFKYFSLLNPQCLCMPEDKL